ncbi:MAG: hypothetical protein ING36_03885, partial [Burkholderiales bacterium]|nr:hypothetical protein [Burkholderiales bacterium]
MSNAATFVQSYQQIVRTQADDVNGDGALLAGQRLEFNLSGNLNNSGALAGRQLVSLNAENINNLGGRITA